MSKRDIPSKATPPSVLDAAAGLAHAESAIASILAQNEHNERLATLGILAAGIAHEISNILTPVLAYAQLAAAHPDDLDLQAKAIAKTVSGIELATRISDAVLGFAGRNDQTQADVADVVQATLDCMAYDPNKDRVQIAVETQPGTTVTINPLSLQQVLTNLVLNARAAMGGESSSGDARGGRGKITIAAITRADGTVGIRVTDTGPGIPKEIAGRIFEPFVTTKRSPRSPGSASDRSAAATNRSPSGTGLGLAICRRLIEQAGGTITAMSKPNEGTTFIISLPTPKTQRAKAG